MRRGIAVAPGVAIGTAYCIHEVFVNPDRPSIRSEEVASELAKFDIAYEKTLEEIRLLQIKAQRQIGKQAAAVFEAHETM